MERPGLGGSEISTLIANLGSSQHAVIDISEGGSRLAQFSLPVSSRITFDIDQVLRSAMPVALRPLVVSLPDHNRLQSPSASTGLGRQAI